jgi:small subunit ribosomal protein S11
MIRANKKKMAKVEKKKKKNVVVESVGQAHVQSTFNNIIVSLTNNTGQVISWSSAGKMAFKGSKKNTPYAAQLAAEQASKEAMDLGLRKVKVFVKGPGAGRESAIRTIHNTGIEVLEIVDITPLPHNGCRPPKKRRI